MTFVLPSLAAVPTAALLTAVLVVLLRPWLSRYALARPNARSSHVAPTPQGGGIAVGVAVLATTGAALAGTGVPGGGLTLLAGAALALAGLGAVDDVRPLPALPRLAVQALAVGAVALTLDGRVLPALPGGLERALLLLAGLWFVNLVNFMDGLDWLTVAEGVPVAAALLAFGLAGRLDPAATLLAAALLGGLLGFAPFNRPVARLFLGDVGALPLGLVLAHLLHDLAARGGLAAALLLPLYYLADATLTLLRRALRREPVWRAHREHYYQRATANGLSVPAVVGRVFGLNLALAALAAATLALPSPVVDALAIGTGSVLVGLTLRAFAHPRPS